LVGEAIDAFEFSDTTGLKDDMEELGPRATTGGGGKNEPEQW
jgi:hypothetical protein